LIKAFKWKRLIILIVLSFFFRIVFGRDVTFWCSAPFHKRLNISHHDFWVLLYHYNLLCFSLKGLNSITFLLLLSKIKALHALLKSVSHRFCKIIAKPSTAWPFMLYYISTLKLRFAQINYLEMATCVESYYKQIDPLAPYAFPYGQNLKKKIFMTCNTVDKCTIKFIVFPIEIRNKKRSSFLL